MVETSLTSHASTARAVSAEAQSREKGVRVPEEHAKSAAQEEWAGLGTRFVLGENVARVPPPPLKRQSKNPLYRPLRIFAIDPATSRLGRSRW